MSIGRFTETAMKRALDPSGGLGFFQRFQYRLLAYMVVFSFFSSILAYGIYYSRQVKFVEAEQAKRGSTLIGSLAVQSGSTSLSASFSDRSALFASARRIFQETDVSFAYIYDNQGTLLIKMTKPGIKEDLGLPKERLRSLLKNPPQNPIRRQRTDSYDDLLVPILSAAGGSSVKPALGVARLGLSRLPAQKKLSEVRGWGILLAFIILTIGTLVGLLLARRISQPIMDLARGADRIRRGDLGYQLKLKRSDELGLLAVSFNRMSLQLRQTVESLAHLNRNLEREVANRTVDLRRSRDFVVLLNAPLQLDKLLDSTLSALLHHTEGLAGAIFLSRAKNAVELVVSQGALAKDFHTSAGEVPEFVQQVVNDESPRVIEPDGVDLLLIRDIPETKALLCVPVRFRDNLEAVLVLGLKNPPQKNLIDFVEHAASELAIAVANTRAFTATERLAKELERRNVALLQQRDQLQEVNRLKTEFLTNVSHELRTPLNAIIGYTDLLVDGIYGEINEDQHQSLSGISESARNLLEMINQILDLSKVDAGKMKLTLKEVNLGQLIRDVVDFSAPLVRDRPYTLSMKLSEPIMRVKTDPTMVRQILINLVSNAVKFTTQGSVDISAWFDAEENALICISDSGIGIRSEHLDVIFDEFRQVDGSSTRRHGGTGLGLAISKKFATLLGGDIIAESTHGKGSKFTLILHRAKVHVSTDEHDLPGLAVTIGESDERSTS